MDKQKLTLKIKDLVLLKQAPEEYWKRQLKQQTKKTHDGTSMGKVRTAMSQWAKDNWDKEWYNDRGGGVRDWLGGWLKPNVTLDKNGKIIAKDWFATDEISYGHGFSYNNLTENQKTEVHFIDTDPAKSSAHADGLPIPGFSFGNITRKNEKGEFYIRSDTIVGEGGSYITAIRNDDFNESNLQEYETLRVNMGMASYNYKSQYSSLVLQDQWKAKKLMENGREDEARQVLKKADERAVKELGTWEENVLEKQGYREKLANCNVKIRITRNGNNFRGQQLPSLKDNKDKYGNPYPNTIYPNNYEDIEI